MFKRGDQVEFSHQSHGVITGTIKSVNKQTVTVENTSDGRRGWRVPPGVLRPLGSAPAVVQYPAVAFSPGDTVEVAIPDPWTRSPTLIGVVTQFAPGRVEVYAHGRALTDDGSRLHAHTRRPFAEVLAEVRGVYNGLSPENLFADGERSRSQAQKLAAVYNRALRALFVEAGRRISEEEAYGTA